MTVSTTTISIFFAVSLLVWTTQGFQVHPVPPTQTITATTTTRMRKSISTTTFLHEKEELFHSNVGTTKLASSHNAAHNHTNETKRKTRQQKEEQKQMDQQQQQQQPRQRKYQRVEEWDAERKSKGIMSWEERVQYDGQRYGNQIRQNDILQRSLYT